jgi:hypothetical protein
MNRLSQWAVIAAASALLLGCAQPAAPRATTPAARPVAASASTTTDTVTASAQGFELKMEMPAGPLSAETTYPVVLTLTNETSQAARIWTHVENAFNLRVEAGNRVVYDWYQANGWGGVIGHPGEVVLAPGQSLVEHREFVLPSTGIYTVSPSFTMGLAKQRVGRMLTARVEAR